MLGKKYRSQGNPGPFDIVSNVTLTLEALGGGGVKLTPPPRFFWL